MDYSKLENKIGYIFQDKSLLETALSHSSYTYEKFNTPEGNERLEFLGDSVLGLVIGEFLYKKNSKMREGAMSKTRALIVCENSLAEVATSIDLGKYLKLGKGEKASGGNNRDSNLANATEALIAAVYLDGGFQKAKELIEKLFSKIIHIALKGKLVHDYKSKLLEYFQGNDDPPTVEFHLVKEEGPVHERIFFVHVQANKKVIGEGFGYTKKEAEQNASQKALESLKVE